MVCNRLLLLVITLPILAWAQGGVYPPSGAGGSSGSSLVNWRGVWSSATAYNANDLVVSSGGVSYTALQANTNQSVSNATYWQALAPQWMPIVASYVGNPGAGATVYIFTATDAFVFPANFSGSTVSCGTNPAATATYTVANNGTSIGTLSISTTCVGTYTTTGGTLKSVAAGDRITMTAPNPQDNNAANIGISLRALRQ